MEAFVIKIGDDLYATTHEEDITLGTDTYTANGIIVEISPTQAQAQFPSHSFQIRCDQGSAAYNLFAEGTGPKPAILSFLEQNPHTLAWVIRWSFEGILGGGGMARKAINPLSVTKPSLSST